MGNKRFQDRIFLKICNIQHTQVHINLRSKKKKKLIMQHINLIKFMAIITTYNIHTRNIYF